MRVGFNEVHERRSLTCFIPRETDTIALPWTCVQMTWEQNLHLRDSTSVSFLFSLDFLAALFHGRGLETGCRQIDKSMVLIAQQDFGANRIFPIET